ncbi:MAG: hypothetical protein ACI86M_002206 [Saprospiraceae bacterium]|jgi:hypothetical protein
MNIQTDFVLIKYSVIEFQGLKPFNLFPKYRGDVENLEATNGLASSLGVPLCSSMLNIQIGIYTKKKINLSPIQHHPIDKHLYAISWEGVQKIYRSRE